ncbi:Conserved oligomeric Golgi complex [Babesia duncani]|uniref:Conserved oligomeric Golgi complex n=1 Tax=Babesia duncani TaxID=323732 RepID=A0AAD9UMD0_9APIC|nr:Conserved oligomeric Golgi complex [Babesia duncani]
MQYSSSGSEHNVLNTIIQNARNLLMRQASIVHSELGVDDYIRICREIYSMAGKEASLAFFGFMRSRFSEIIQGNIDDNDLLAFIEKQLDNTELLNRIASDMKDLDKLLDDMVALCALWIDFERGTKEHLRPIYKMILINTQNGEYGEDGLEKLGETTRIVQSILGIYVRLEHVSATGAVVQAIKVADSIYLVMDDINGHQTSTMVEDVFYVLQKVQYRAISTGDIQAACATFNQVAGIIGNDLKEALFRSLMESQSIYGEWIQIPTNLTQGSWHAMLEEYFKKFRQPIPEYISSKYSFIHCLNNIEECLNCIGKFQDQMLQCFQQEFTNEQDILLIESAVQALDSVKVDIHNIQDTGCNYALNMLKIHVADPLNLFGSIDFNMDEEIYNTYQSDNVFVQQLTSALIPVFKHLQICFAPNTKSKCICILLERVCKYMEIAILSKRFSIYGALYFDEAIRQVMSSCTAFEQHARKQFTVLLHISDILNVTANDDLTDVITLYGEAFVEQYRALKLAES